MVLPVVDLEEYWTADSVRVDELCREVSRSLHDYGALLVKDPRCSIQDNDRFLDMIERYYQCPSEFKLLQSRPHLHYQAGVTPGGMEVPRSLVDKRMQEKMQALSQQNRPSPPKGADCKWRYMWRLGTQNAEPVIPVGFPEWKDIMDSWGHKMISAIEVVAEMAAIGFGLPKDAFTSIMKQGPHLLAPTGYDLERYGDEGTVFAGYHYDLNFLTIHGRCRFPGLNIWLRNGKKVEVDVPLGCLMVQTGKQMEWLTGGHCLAGMHEVVVETSTKEAIRLASDQNRTLWRVTSILFAHIASDAVLKPLGHFADSPLASEYPSIRAREFVENEISVLNLK